MDEAKNQINDMQHKEAKNNQSEQEKKKNPKNEDSISSLWDNFKSGSNTRTIWVPEGEEKEQGIGNLEEKIMKENVPNLVKEIDTQVQGAHRVPNKMDAEAHSKTHHN